MLKLAIRRFEKESVFDVTEDFVINGERFSKDAHKSFFDFVMAALESETKFFEFSDHETRLVISKESILYILEKEGYTDEDLLK